MHNTVKVFIYKPIFTNLSQHHYFYEFGFLVSWTIHYPKSFSHCTRGSNKPTFINIMVTIELKASYICVHDHDLDARIVMESPRTSFYQL